MAFLDYQPPKCDTASRIFSALSSLHLKSNKYRSRGVLPAILAAATQLSSLTLQFQVSRPALAVEEADTLSDDDLQVELQTKVREDFTIKEKAPPGLLLVELTSYLLTSTFTFTYFVKVLVKHSVLYVKALLGISTFSATVKSSRTFV